MKHKDETFQGAGNLELYCQSWHPDKKLLGASVFVHGFGDHSNRHPNLMNRLVEGGYVVYAFDLRGHGRSAGQRGHINCWAEFREDLRTFLKYAEEQETGIPVFLIGFSMGGLIVLEYVMHQPGAAKGVVAIAPVLGKVGVPKYLLIIARIMNRIWPRLSLDSGMDKNAMSRDKEVIRRTEDDPLWHRRGTLRLASEMMAARNWTQSHSSELKTPLLILHGGADRSAPPEASRRFFQKVTFPDKEMIEYEEAYHELDNDIDSDDVLIDLVKWLNRHV